ncbi:MAG: sugar transferase [Acidimicrobiales bacterium]
MIRARSTTLSPLKRGIDIAVSTVALIALSPMLVVVAIMVRMRLGSPVLFRQARPGLHGEPFELLKFRTMTAATGPDGVLLPDGDRTHPFGERLRRTSLDELPELMNVLRGDMSLVGPRPLLMRYLDRYSPEQMRRHDVRPGLTGLAQVSGRNDLSWDERFELDVYYVDHHSLRMDLSILARTVTTVTKGHGVAAEGMAIGAEEFMGSR